MTDLPEEPAVPDPTTCGSIAPHPRHTDPDCPGVPLRPVSTYADRMAARIEVPVTAADVTRQRDELARLQELIQETGDALGVPGGTAVEAHPRFARDLRARVSELLTTITVSESATRVAELRAELGIARAELARVDPAKVAGWIAERDDLAGQLAATEVERDTAVRDRDKAREAVMLRDSRIADLVEKLADVEKLAAFNARTRDGFRADLVAAGQVMIMARDAVASGSTKALAAALREFDRWPERLTGIQMVVVDRDDLTTVLDQRVMHAHRRPGRWDADGRPCGECAARRRLWAALAAQLTDVEKDVEYGIRITWDDGTVEDLPRDSQAQAVRSLEMHTRARRGRAGWRVTAAELIERTITTGPWRLAEPAETPTDPPGGDPLPDTEGCPSRIAYESGVVLRCQESAGHDGAHGNVAVGWWDDDDRVITQQPTPDTAQTISADHDHATGYPTFDPDAELCVNTSDGAEMWTGARWNEHVTAAQRNRNGVLERVIAAPMFVCTTTCPAREG